MIEPFRDWNESGIRRDYIIANDYFSASVADLAAYRLQPIYAREIPAAVRRVITLIQPAMIILLGGVVLLVALAIMLPILNIYNTIGVRR